MKKNITIEVLTDLYYVRFIAIWRPEEEASFETPETDSRPEAERNIPYILVTSLMFKGRSEVVGNNPVVPSQHPIPQSFLKQQVRHISYMFANELGIFQPPTKMHADLFLTKMRLGYKKIKELKVAVSAAQGSMSLKDLRDSLTNFSEKELEKIQVMTIGEHPDDAHAKNIDSYIHTIGNSITPQYISVNKLINIYDIKNSYVNTSSLPELEDIGDSYAPGTENENMTLEQMEFTKNAIANDEAERILLQTIDDLTDEQKMEADTQATEIVKPLTRDEIQKETIKRLQAELKKFEK